MFKPTILTEERLMLGMTEAVSGAAVDEAAEPSNIHLVDWDIEEVPSGETCERPSVLDDDDGI